MKTQLEKLSTCDCDSSAIMDLPVFVLDIFILTLMHEESWIYFAIKMNRLISHC